MRRVLWVGDAGCDTGFARCTERTIVPHMAAENHVAVIGLNYYGDPHPFRDKVRNMYPAYVPGSGDLFGVGRVAEVTYKERPDVIVFQNDPWNIPKYVDQLESFPDTPQTGGRPMLVGTIAVDGLNCRGWALNGLDHVFFWTEFGRQEAIKGGLVKPSSVIPLGVDLDIYKPGDRTAARKALGIHENVGDKFVVVNVNRNQPRKRLDLTFEYFAEFFHNHTLKDAYLYLHVCPTGDTGFDLDQLTAYYGLQGHVILADPGAFRGVSEREMCLTYQAADALMSTTQGEGWGLTTMEAMACGVPCAVPDWSALGEWTRRLGGDRPAAYLVPCTATALTYKVNVVGGIADRSMMVSALTDLYNFPQEREKYAQRGLELVNDPAFRWENISRTFTDELARAYSRFRLGL